MSATRALLALALAASLGSAQNLALSVDGDDSALRVPTHPSLEPSDELTVECWIKGQGANSHGRIVRKAANFGDGYMLSWSFQGNQLSGLIDCDGFVTAKDPVFNAQYVDAWHHIAMTHRAGGELRFFVDGELVRSEAGRPCQGHTDDLYFGAAFGVAEEFIGLIDEVRIWSVERTPQQIADSYDVFLEDAPGLVSVWHLDGNGADAVGGNDGVLLGNAQYVADGAPLTFGFEPRRGPWQGGQVVELTGSFPGLVDPEVRFGGVVAKRVLEVSDTRIVVVTPRLEAPGVEIQVDVIEGTFAQSASLRYTTLPRVTHAVLPVGGDSIGVDVVPGSTVVASVGVPAALEFAGPGVGWGTQLAAPVRVFGAEAGLTDRFDFALTVPAALVGQQVVAVQLYVVGPDGAATYSNAVEVALTAD